MSNTDCYDELGLAHVPPQHSESVRSTLTVVLSVFPILTMVGNSLVILVILANNHLHTVTNALVLSLAVADLFVAILVMPYGIYKQYTGHVWTFGRTWCVHTQSIDVMLSTVSILHVSCLAFDRYMAVCWPFVHLRITKKHVIAMILHCWFVPVFISFLPLFNNWHHVGIEHIVNCVTPELSHTCRLIVNAVYGSVSSVVSCFVPAMLFVVCYIKIYQVAKRHAQEIHDLESSLRNMEWRRKGKDEIKAAKTIGLVISCFCCCWLPFFVLAITDPFIGYTVPYDVLSVTLWLGYINSMFNPFLYYMFDRDFQIAIRHVLRCRSVASSSESSFAVVHYHARMSTVTGTVRHGCQQ
jgi:5-hydroxytryptamine receptor 4